jgi:hypothetical protein
MTASTAPQILCTRSRPHAAHRRVAGVDRAARRSADRCHTRRRRCPDRKHRPLVAIPVSGLDTATDDMCVLRDACA